PRARLVAPLPRHPLHRRDRVALAPQPSRRLCHGARPAARRRKMTGQPLGRGIGAKVLLLGVSGAVALLLGEGLLRVAAPQPPSCLDVYRRHPSLPSYALETNLARRLATGESSWAIYTDADGCRVPRLPVAKPGAAPALVLGDSFAFGQGVNYEET